MKDLTESQLRHLEWLEQNGGYLAAGAQELGNTGRGIVVRASVLRALERRGIVEVVTSPDGGIACRRKQAKPTIEATTYTRDDGPSMFRKPNGLWTVRDSHGLPYFWSFETAEWVCTRGIRVENEGAFEREESVARAVLERVPRVTSD